MKKAARPIELTPVRREIVSPAEYVRMTKESPHLIAHSRFLAPAVGKRDFGSFEIQYSVPVLRRIAA